MRGPLVVLGDALLDVDVEGDVERLCPEAPVPIVDVRERISRPGGAGLAAALAAEDDHDVVLVTSLARDDEGAELRRLLAGAGIEVVDLGGAASTAVKERVRCDGRVLLRMDAAGQRGAVPGPLPDRAARALALAAAVLVADYGRGVSAAADVRRALVRASRSRPVVWDPHPRGPEPVPGARLVTPNAREAARLVPETEGDDLRATTTRARTLLARWRARAVAVTLGAEGALLADAGARSPVVVPAPPVSGGDPCGAGDRFASSVAGALADGALLPEAVATAVAKSSAFVAAGGAGSVRLDALLGPRRDPAASAEEVVARTRAAGGRIVMTGGCFDLLHAGHVHTLQAARALGDCLVVCLNSDESVRRLKGFDRPLVPEEDRAAVLAALGCVDAVVVFEEDTPHAVLDRFRPDVFAKGGDYALENLPEAETLAGWGGEVAVLPYVEGRSTTRLLEEVLVRGAG
jgi:D-beta-D-heptose 7-phosphate kinase / D-beta-D-heptose 1-phosphate adenosyltransferase